MSKENELYFHIKTCFTLTTICLSVQEKKGDLDATVYNLLLSTVLMLQNARGALFIFLCLRK